MHILAILAAVAGGLLFWYLRSRRAADAVEGVVDAAQSVRGAVKRRRHANLSDASAITAIDDPLIATAALAHIVAGPDMWPRTHAAVRGGLVDLAGERRADEAVTFAEWAARQGVDEDRAVDTLCKTLLGALDETERARALEILRQGVGTAEGESLQRFHRAERQLHAP